MFRSPTAAWRSLFDFRELRRVDDAKKGTRDVALQNMRRKVSSVHFTPCFS
jgi:hypothetical protein